MPSDDVIVFCEGPRDLNAVELYYQTHQPETTVIPFDANDLTYSTLRSQESDRLRSFLARQWGDVLIKSEGGVEDLRKAFADLLKMLIDQPPQICLMIDLDTGPSREWRSRRDSRMGRLAARVQDKHGEQYGIEHAERLARSEELSAHRYRLTADEYGNTGPFTVLTFHTNLEDAAETGDHHSDEKQEEKLRTFVTSDDAAPMREVL